MRGAGAARRVTLRCICEDLTGAWQEPADQRVVQRLREHLQATPVDQVLDSEVAGFLRQIPPLARLRHPLIDAFDNQFSSTDDDGVLRESISAVSDRQWLKQKYSFRWRGAAALVINSRGTTAWLGAAGYHREGSPEDFYDWFASACASSSDLFMPQPPDVLVERVDWKISQLDAWKLQLHLSTLALLISALDSGGSAGPLRVVLPTNESVELLKLSMTVDSVEEPGETITEVTAVINASERKHAVLQDIATRTILAAIEPLPEAWRAAPLSDMVISYAALLSDATADEARRTVIEGELTPDRVPGEIRLGTIAHYAPVEHLTSATVKGEPVQAICGYWFVPMHDHESLEVCSICEAAHQQLPG